MKNINKQNTDQENSDSLLNERQDEARNERSECSCPQSSGSPLGFRETMILELSKIILKDGIDRKQTMSMSPFCSFLRANPVRLVDSILEGKLLTGEEMVEIYGSWNSSSDSRK